MSSVVDVSATCACGSTLIEAECLRFSQCDAGSEGALAMWAVPASNPPDGEGASGMHALSGPWQSAPLASSLPLAETRGGCGEQWRLMRLRMLCSSATGLVGDRWRKWSWDRGSAAERKLITPSCRKSKTALLCDAHLWCMTACTSSKALHDIAAKTDSSDGHKRHGSSNPTCQNLESHRLQAKQDKANAGLLFMSQPSHSKAEGQHADRWQAQQPEHIISDRNLDHTKQLYKMRSYDTIFKAILR
jgi:hypothetical protein